MPRRDPRFDNPGRPNDFPGRPLLDDYQLRSIAGIDEYRDIDEFDDFLRLRVRGGATLRVNAGSTGEITPPAVPLIGSLDATASLILQAEHRPSRMPKSSTPSTSSPACA